MNLQKLQQICTVCMGSIPASEPTVYIYYEKSYTINLYKKFEKRQKYCTSKMGNSR